MRDTKFRCSVCGGPIQETFDADGGMVMVAVSEHYLPNEPELLTHIDCRANPNVVALVKRLEAKIEELMGDLAARELERRRR